MPFEEMSVGQTAVTTDWREIRFFSFVFARRSNVTL